MPTVKHNGKEYKINSRGFLAKVPKALDPNWVAYVCKEVDIPVIQPGDEKWGYIEKVHEYLLRKRGEVIETRAQNASELSREVIFEKFGKLAAGLCRMAGATAVRYYCGFGPGSWKLR